MPGKTSLIHLFPPESIHELPTWRFVLHVTSPTFFKTRALNKAISALTNPGWKVTKLSCQPGEVTISPKTKTLDVPIEVPENLRRSPTALEDYESDFWKLYAALVEAGFGDAYYEAIDWREQCEQQPPPLPPN
jgi:hypothetical protein